jgi:hypothetical protein
MFMLQGGGHSILSPVYGLGVDRVVRPFPVGSPALIYHHHPSFNSLS